MNEYKDIINLSHFEPKYHQRMTIYNRSAQFAPFAALTGYEDAIIETSRLTDEKIELDDDVKENINMKLSDIRDNIDNVEVKILYFKKDNKKNGGEYLEHIGKIKKMDTVDKKLIFQDGLMIKIDDLVRVDYE